VRREEDEERGRRSERDETGVKRRGENRWREKKSTK
jgi:hypothetical protein